jgi:hypothetical protein
MIWQRRHSRDFRDLRRAQMPLDHDRERDPWGLPSAVFVALVLAYFIYQFSR